MRQPSVEAMGSSQVRLRYRAVCAGGGRHEAGLPEPALTNGQLPTDGRLPARDRQQLVAANPGACDRVIIVHLRREMTRSKGLRDSLP